MPDSAPVNDRLARLKLVFVHVLVTMSVVCVVSDVWPSGFLFEVEEIDLVGALRKAKGLKAAEVVGLVELMGPSGVVDRNMFAPMRMLTELDVVQVGLDCQKFCMY